MAKKITQNEFERVCAPGEVIVKEGQAGREMFIIRSGRVTISKRVGERETELAVLGKGDFFGEMSLLEGQPRDATARAVRETKLLVIQPGGLLIRIRRDPTFAYEMLQKMSGRVRDLNAWVTRSLASGEGAKVPEATRTLVGFSAVLPAEEPSE